MTRKESKGSEGKEDEYRMKKTWNVGRGGKERKGRERKGEK